jgi:hypothetical protein
MWQQFVCRETEAEIEMFIYMVALAVAEHIGS